MTDSKLFQVALLHSLMLGNYEGTISAAELKKHGDFGLGTFDGLDGENYFYAVKLTGCFASMHTRSEWGQKRPYRPLDAVMKVDQTEFRKNETSGTLIGLWCPAYAGAINMPGWHFHYLDKEKDFGGHVIEAVLISGRAEVTAVRGFEMVLPETEEFRKMNLSEDLSERINKVE